MLVLIPGKIVSSIDITPVPGFWKVGVRELLPGMNWWSLFTGWESSFLNSAGSLLFLLNSWSHNSWLLEFLLESKFVSLISSPGILWSGPGAVSLNGDVVDTSDDSDETLLTEVGTPRVSDGPVLGSVLNTVSNNRDIVDDVLITSLILEDSTSVVLKGSWDSNTAGNWTSLVDFLHHLLLTRNLTVLISVVDLVVVLVPAALAWGAVLAHDLLGALGTIIMSSGSVDGAGLISDLVLVHPLEGVVSFTTVATIILGAGNENLRGDVDIWPGCLSLDLDSIRHGRGGGMSPA